MAIENNERICFNCNYFYPACEDITEYGICLYDDDFEPYIDAIFEYNDYSACRDLIVKKRFRGDKEVCDKFEMAEIIEVDDYTDDSYLSEQLDFCRDTDETDQEKLERMAFEKKMEGIDWKNVPAGQFAEKLVKGSPEEQEAALRKLEILFAQGNREAFEVLFDHLRTLPSPEKIEETHKKIDILEVLKIKATPNQRARLVVMLMDEMRKVESNNITRQWITRILKYMASLSEEEAFEPLATLLADRKFAPRLRGRIEDILIELSRKANC